MINVGLVSFWRAENDGSCFDINSSYATESSYYLLKQLKNSLSLRNINFDSHKRFDFNDIDIFIYKDLPVDPYINFLINKSNKIKILWQHEISYLRPDSWENISCYNFDGVISWKDSNHHNFLKIGTSPYITANPMVLEEFVNSKPIAMINSNRRTNFQCGYQIRDFIINYPNKIVDLYGTGWNRFRFAEDSHLSFLNAKPLNYLFRVKPPINFIESLESKYLIKNKYKAHLIIENFIENDYITEKIWDALNIGAVPIYIGPPNIYDIVDVDKPFFIDYNNFKSPEEILCYIQNLQYEDYLNYFTNFFIFSDKSDNIYNVDHITNKIYSFLVNLFRLKY